MKTSFEGFRRQLCPAAPSIDPLVRSAASQTLIASAAMQLLAFHLVAVVAASSSPHEGGVTWIEQFLAQRGNHFYAEVNWP